MTDAEKMRGKAKELLDSIPPTSDERYEDLTNEFGNALEDFRKTYPPKIKYTLYVMFAGKPKRKYGFYDEKEVKAFQKFVMKNEEVTMSFILQDVIEYSVEERGEGLMIMDSQLVLQEGDGVWVGGELYVVVKVVRKFGYLGYNTYEIEKKEE